MMKKFLNKIFIIIILISLIGCDKTVNETSVPVLSHTNPEAVRAVLQEEITGEITVLGYDNNTTLLEKTAKVFKEKYPGTNIKIEKYQPEPTVKSYEQDDGTIVTEREYPDEEQAQRDFINRINTEFMGGQGADIILTDIIPWYRYADMGYLEDFRIYMEQDTGFNTDDYRMNIINATEYKGGVYALPISAVFSFFVYDNSLFNDEERGLLSSKDTFTFSELMGIANAAFERNDKENNMFGFTGGEWSSMHIFNQLLGENYADFVEIANKKANFDNGRFEKLLLSVTDYCKRGYLKKVSEFNQLFASADSNPNPDERFFYKHEVYRSLLQNFDKELPGMRIYLPTYGNDEDDAVAGIAAESSGGVPFTPVDMYVFNSNSKSKRTAWEFIKLLISEEMQTELEVSGIPVNRGAFEVKEMADLTMGGFKSSRLNDDNRQAFDDYLECLNRFANMINTYTLRDNRIDGWIYEEASLYFNGEKSAKAVAKALQNKVNLYLNE